MGATDRFEKGIRVSMKECIKKPYSSAAVDKEVERLRLSEPDFGWRQYQCDYCGFWHVLRITPEGYRGEEAKKAIALWRQKRG